jgi:hypothetical protein
MTSQSIARPAGLLNALSDAWSRYRKRRAAMVELRSLGDVEIDRIVKDAGLTFHDLLDLAKQDGEAASLLYRRLKEAGIDVKGIETGVLRDLQRCCSMCESKTQCAHDLEDMPKPQAASWPAYCPNKPTIEALGQCKCH